MARRYGLSFVFVLACAVFAAAAANAQWIKDGVPAGRAEGEQGGPKIVPDGAGGAMIVWADTRSGISWNIYGNRVTGDGVVLGGSGIPLCETENNQWLSAFVYDEAGAGIVVWLNDTPGGMEIMAHKVDTAGNLLWPPDGILVCPEAVNPGTPVAVPDGAGGVILAWDDSRSGDVDIFAQRIDAYGNVLWGDSGAAVCRVASAQYGPAIASDGAGGAIIAWTDFRGDGDIYAQRIDGDGIRLWDTMAVEVCTAGNNQFAPVLSPASGGGVYVTWSDMREGYDDVYVQWIDAFGLAMWQYNGISVCDDVGWGYSKWVPVLVADGSGGAIVVWSESRTDDMSEMFGQRIDELGARVWGMMGRMIIPCYGWSSVAGIIPDGAGGAIVTIDVYWDDYSPSDICAQRVDHDGNVLWGARGVAVCAAEEAQAYPVLAPDGTGGVIIAWEDVRPETSYEPDIYCQRVDGSGLWGSPKPEILSCADVPEDQGGWVRITTRASALDAVGEDIPIFGYNVWRLIESGGGPLLLSATAAGAEAPDRAKTIALLSDPATAKGVRVSASQAAALGLPEGDWESVGFWFATRDTIYNIAVPTKDDSTEAGTPWETFIVTAHASLAGVFAASDPADGYSVDNLAPGLTAGFAGAEIASPPGLMLTWDPNAAADIWKYNIHRGDDAVFAPDETNLLDSTTDLELHDPSWARAYQYFYKLVAVDRHGNKGPEALLRPEDIKVGTMLQSFVASLKQWVIEVRWTLSELDEDAALTVHRITGGAVEELPREEIVRQGLSFVVVDRSIEPGTAYRYRVSVVERGGSRVLFETDEITTPAMPLTLHQNHPNPFNPATTIGYYLPEASVVTLEIYDSAGRLVSRLHDGAKQEKGTHEAVWRGLDAGGRSVSSGVYFYRLVTGKETISKKMVLLR